MRDSDPQNFTVLPFSKRLHAPMLDRPSSYTKCESHGSSHTQGRSLPVPHGAPSGSRIPPAALRGRPVAITQSWWTPRDSDPRPPVCQTGALPVELGALVPTDGLEPSLSGFTVRRTHPNTRLGGVMYGDRTRPSRFTADHAHQYTNNTWCVRGESDPHGLAPTAV